MTKVAASGAGQMAAVRAPGEQMNREGQRSNRRAVIKLLALGGGLTWSGVAAAQVCVDLSKLPPGDLSLRRSVNFKTISPNPKRACGGCAFFSAVQSTSCGKCAILSGAAVAASSVCDSWAPKS
jgi:hypothetical protein